MGRLVRLRRAWTDRLAQLQDELTTEIQAGDFGRTIPAMSGVRALALVWL